MRRILLAGVAASLFLAGCGSDGGSTSLADVKVTKSDVPKVTVAEGFTADKTETRVVEPGSGAELTADDSVKVNIVAVNGRTGKEFDNSFASGQSLTISLSGQTLEGFRSGLIGQKVGSRVLVAIPPEDGFGDQGQSAYGVQADDTMIFLFDVVATVPLIAEGKAKDLTDALPKLVLEDGKPTKFEKTDDSKGAPRKASRHVVIEGTGPEVKEGQTLTTQYLGQVYPDGTIFDSSWERGAPSKFSLQQVIPCWQDQLAGVKTGSRVVLVCPPDTAYADQGTPDGKVKPGDTLLFAIDVLDAS